MIDFDYLEWLQILNSCLTFGKKKKEAISVDMTLILEATNESPNLLK